MNTAFQKMDLFLSTGEPRWTLWLWLLLTDANWVGAYLHFHLKMEIDEVSETLCISEQWIICKFQKLSNPKYTSKISYLYPVSEKITLLVLQSSYTDIKTQFFPYIPHSQRISDLQYQFHSSVHRYVDWCKCNYITKLQMLLLPKIIKMWACI
jgi:hypothetical protein